MSDAGDAAPVAGAPTAGRLLREAREKQGLHIAALAASIKVAPKKLEMLEGDRFDALPDATFTRALAQTVCRALKIDPTAILGLLPPPSGYRLDHVGVGLNAPFRDRPGALVQREGSTLAFGPWTWLTALVVLAAVGVFFVPAGMIKLPHWLDRTAPAASESGVVSSESAVLPGESVAASAEPTSVVAPEGRASNAPVAASSAAPTTATVATAQAPSRAPSTSLAPADAAEVPAGVLQVRASQASWVEVTDARGRSLVSRVVRPGEALALDGEAPFRLRIGNAHGTQVSFRGQPMALAAYTRDNVARFELK